MSVLIISLIISFFLGAALASFVHCWANRLYSGVGFKKRSHCPRCRHKLSWFHNIPIFSYLGLGGKCAYCHKPIAKSYLVSEIVGGLALLLAFVVIWQKLGGESGFWLALDTYRAWFIVGQAIIGLVLLMLIFWSDYWWLSIFTKPILIGALILAVLGLLSGRSWFSLLLGAVVGGLFFAVQFWLSKGRWVGEGDIYLGLLLGVWLGWPVICLTILFAYLLGSIVGLSLLALKRKDWSAKLPLGVFLAPSGWLFFLCGQQLWQQYIHWLGW